MKNPLQVSGIVALALLGATATGVALILAKDPTLLKRLVKRGVLTYQRAMTLLAETREEVGDMMAEAVHEAEQELVADQEAASTVAQQAAEDLKES